MHFSTFPSLIIYITIVIPFPCKADSSSFSTLDRVWKCFAFFVYNTFIFIPMGTYECWYMNYVRVWILTIFTDKDIIFTCGRLGSCFQFKVFFFLQAGLISCPTHTKYLPFRFLWHMSRLQLIEKITIKSVREQLTKRLYFYCVLFIFSFHAWL